MLIKLKIYSGFITKDQISTYQKNALETNMQEWQMLLVNGIKKIFFLLIYLFFLVC
jgi:hypothetical protein